MSFPLERHPGSIVFVDDDETYLTVIENILPREWNIKTFPNATDFVEHMQAKIAVAKDMSSYQRGAIDRYKRSGSVAIEVLRYWNAFPERYSLPQVVVIDYHMPNLNGLEALEKVKEWNGKKALLTGVADEAIVCRAFNARIIDYYVAKQSARIMQEIVSAVKLMLNNYAATDRVKWTAWYMSMKPEQKLFMQEPNISKALFDFVDESYEHVAIGDPFGVMALGHNGGVKWLQLETSASLDAAAELAMKMGGSADDAQSVRVGRKLTDARIKSALSIAKKPAFAPCKFEIRIPSINEVLFGAAFDINAVGAPPAEMCYSAWHERQENFG